MIEKLREALAVRKVNYYPDSELRPAAVLLPLFLRDDEYRVVFIKRTQKVRVHKGQISFPGGSREPDDENMQAAALREAQEEIGLSPEDVDVLGRLDDMPTIGSAYVVSPFVGLIPWPYQFRPDSFEVDSIIDVPLSWLLDERHVTSEMSYELGMPLDTYFYRYRRDVIWGASARILHQFLEIYRTL